MRRGALFLLVLLLPGCVYYNGMYNANKYAKRARKAQAEGRTFEAQGYWAQAEVRADSVVVRHPNSSWTDDAQLIRGEAMVNRGDCDGARPALEQASFSRDSPKVARQAQALLGQCLLTAGDYAGADRAFVALMASPDTAFSQPARLQHARILRMDGDYQAALEALDGMRGTAVDDERAADYAGLGDLAQATPLIEAALARQDLSVAWDSTLAGVGRVDPALASRYTAEVTALPGLNGERRDALLIADAARLMRSDPDSALARLRQAAAANPVTDQSLVAQLRINQYQLSQADTLEDLERARAGLRTLADIGGPSSVVAIHYLRILDRVRAYRDSITPGGAEGDLATFVLAEAVRDSLPAPRIAAQLFGTVPAWWPASPYAPKALLALAALEPTDADAIFRRAETEYPDSPYLLLVDGEVTPAVVALEDSLQRYSVAQATPAVRPAPGRRAPAGQRQQDELK